MKISSLLIGSLLGLTALSAQAVSTISYTDSVSVTEQSPTTSTTGLNLLSLQQFDTQGGLLTLTNVQLIITLSVPTFTASVDNDSANLANVTVTFGTIGSVGFSSTVSTLDGTFNTLSGSNFSVSTQSSTFNVEANDSDSTATFDLDGGPDNGSFTTIPVLVGQISPRDINPLVWSQYTGTGTFGLDLAIDFVTDLNLNSGGGGGDVRFQGNIPSATYTAEVIYTYIPEPSTALLGALGMLALLRRRR